MRWNWKIIEYRIMLLSDLSLLLIITIQLRVQRFTLRISHSARSISSFGYGTYLEEKIFKRNFFSACVRKSIEIYIYFRDFIFERNIKCVINKKKKKDGRIFLFLTREKFVLSIEWFLLEEKDGQNDSDHVHYSQLFKIHLMDPEETRKWTH